MIVPTIGHRFCPAFVEYPASICLRPETGHDLIVDIPSSLAQSGPCRIYVLNTAVPTTRLWWAAADMLAAQSFRLPFTDILAVGKETVRELQQQQTGTHADEIENSIMLYIAPHALDVRRALRDIHLGTGRLTLTEGGSGCIFRLPYTGTLRSRRARMASA